MPLNIVCKRLVGPQEAENSQQKHLLVRMQVRSIAVDASGQWLASGGDDGTARLWEGKAV